MRGRWNPGCGGVCVEGNGWTWTEGPTCGGSARKARADRLARTRGRVRGDRARQPPLKRVEPLWPERERKITPENTTLIPSSPWTSTGMFMWLLFLAASVGFGIPLELQPALPSTPVQGAQTATQAGLHTFATVA